MTIQTNNILFNNQSGLTFVLTPLTLLGQQHFKDLARKAYPDPDPTPFEKDEINGFLPGQKTAATDDPEYRRLLVEAAIRRDFAYQVLVLESCVTCEGKAELVRQYGETNQSGMSVWLAVPKDYGTNLNFEVSPLWVQLLYLSLCNQVEINEMLNLIQGRLPLSEGEILNGFRYFRRLQLPGDDSVRVASKTSAPTSKSIGKLDTVAS